MASYSILVDGKNTGKTIETGNGVNLTTAKKIATDVYANGDKSRIWFYKLV
jgi:hypothetical protein